MGDLAIRAAGLGKQYRLGAARPRYHTLRDQVRQWAGAPLRALLRRARRAEARPQFWALKDVSFEVRRGEVIGIIGRNGAGKSTLLKVLSRITEPTEGEADIHGRVGSLLEVGTGFHPELTGRENIFLNGAVLGMRRAEIRRKFDEVVGFAEVERFIDTPVKHYSSGMYTRLAFAVAAHLEPEVMIVDEVLAVGDAAFQKKCLGKMGEVAQGGRTVLFVSHNLAQLRRLCTRGVVLDHGRVVLDAPCDEAVSFYQTERARATDAPQLAAALRSDEHDLEIVGYRVAGKDDDSAPTTGEACSVTLTCRFGKEVRGPGVLVSIHNQDGSEVIRISSSPISGVDAGVCRGEVRFTLRIPWLPLAGGPYELHVGVGIPNTYFLIHPVCVGSFDVLPGDPYKTGLEFTRRYGLVAVPHSWDITRPGP